MNGTITCFTSGRKLRHDYSGKVITVVRYGCGVKVIPVGLSETWAIRWCVDSFERVSDSYVKRNGIM